jgi:hypothetical protein
MDRNKGPQQGLGFARPSITTAVRGLSRLQGHAESQGYLTAQQSAELSNLVGAWEFYRDSQPSNYQARIDRLVESLMNTVVAIEKWPL